jgi:hypothetical protein
LTVVSADKNVTVMKSIISICLCLLLLQPAARAQKFANSRWRGLINQTFSQTGGIKALQGYRQHLYQALTSDTPSVSVFVLVKGNTQIVLLTSTDDTTHTIVDVLEIKGVQKNQQLLVSQCLVAGMVNGDLIVLVQNPPPKTLKAKPLRAWRADRDRLHFKKASLVNVTCTFEDP